MLNSSCLLLSSRFCFPIFKDKSSIFASSNQPCSQRVHASRKTSIGRLNFSAMVPVVKVVAAVLSTRFLPFHDASVGLVLHHDALLERGIEVFAVVAAVHGDLHRIELVLCVLLWLKLVIGDSYVVVPERHFKIIFFKLFIY